MSPQRHWADDAAPALAQALEQLVAAGRLPGGVVTLGTLGEPPRTVSAGVIAPECGPAVPDEHTLYDLASVTKLVATWPLIGRAVRAGLLELDAPIGRYFPALPAAAPGWAVTTRQILSHTSGLYDHARLHRYLSSELSLLELLCLEPLISPPGRQYHYIDRGFILLGLLLTELYGQRLDQLADGLWRELGLAATRYGPVERSCRVAPTEAHFGGAPRAWGIPHDPSAALLGGVAGHAGAFSTSADLARYAEHLLAGDAWLAESLHPHAEIEPGLLRGLAWILGADGRVAYHHGFTGTSLYLGPTTGRYIAICTNAVYLGREYNRPTALRDAAFDWISR